jgi:hypothetical protein
MGTNSEQKSKLNTKKQSEKRVEINQIGKIALLERLFANTKYKNNSLLL